MTIKPDMNYVTSAMDRVDVATCRLAAAQAVASGHVANLRDARAAMTAGIASAATGAPVDVTALHEAVATAEREASFADGVVTHTTEKLAEARDAIKRATARAYLPVWEAGRALRISAAKASDAAKAALAQAKADLATAQNMVAQASSQGTHPEFNTKWMHPDPTEAAEQEFWAECK